VTDDAILDAGIDCGSTGCTALVGRRETSQPASPFLFLSLLLSLALCACVRSESFLFSFLHAVEAMLT
jgi:hypothetical protein